MKIIRTAKQMQKLACELKKQRKTIALVPTMGCLHKGHLSLVTKAKKTAAKVIVSIFVNPTQFGPKEDFKKYPRQEKLDVQALEKSGADIVFLPKAADIYPNNFQTWIDVTETTKKLCGASRPGHFRGVTTVVLKLFNITQPDFAIFGKKDYQQLITIKQMVRDLNVPVKIIGAKIVRESDGLALSSRNTYLNGEERIIARRLSTALFSLKKLSQRKKLNPKAALDYLKKEITHDKLVKIDYVDCLDSLDLMPVSTIVQGKTLVAIAAFVGRTRLIDNIIL